MTAENSVPIIFMRGVNKTYASDFQALKKINLEIKRGEIFALLGPNGAGKTTLISIICGIVKATSGTIIADGLVYSFDTQEEETGIAALLRTLGEHSIEFKDLRSSENSLEDIFVSLVHQSKEALE